MQRHFDEELKGLREKLYEMGLSVEASIDKAMRSLFERDSKLAKEVRIDDKKIDDLELEIDAECLRLLALRQPAAFDLRLISMTMRAIHDLERMGDQAVNITDKSVLLNQETPLKPLDDLSKMSEIAKSMVRSALESFIEGNVEKAKLVLKIDDELDQLNYSVYSELSDIMRKKSDTIDRGLNLIMVSHNLERLGDLATNIAEDVIYLIEGIDIRHHKAEQF